jgi:MFS family permease
MYSTCLIIKLTAMLTGFTATPANLLTVPVYVVACIVTCFVGFYADRHGQRGIIVMYVENDLSHQLRYSNHPVSICACVGVIGCIILLVSRNAALSYVAVCLVACGVCPNVSNIIAWVANNVEGSHKRGVTLAMVSGFGGFAGAISANVVSS